MNSNNQSYAEWRLSEIESQNRIIDPKDSIKGKTPLYYGAVGATGTQGAVGTPGTAGIQGRPALPPVDYGILIKDPTPFYISPPVYETKEEYLYDKITLIDKDTLLYISYNPDIPPTYYTPSLLTKILNYLK